MPHFGSSLWKKQNLACIKLKPWFKPTHQPVSRCAGCYLDVNTWRTWYHRVFPYLDCAHAVIGWNYANAVGAVGGLIDKYSTSSSCCLDFSRFYYFPPVPFRWSSFRKEGRKKRRRRSLVTFQHAKQTFHQEKTEVEIALIFSFRCDGIDPVSFQPVLLLTHNAFLHAWCMKYLYNLIIDRREVTL